MKFLVFDFETTGVGVDKENSYQAYSEDKAPLPRKNFPVELAFCLINENGETLKEEQYLICGAGRLDPWVLENCPHLSIKDCQRDGIPFADLLKCMADLFDDKEECILVAHNIQYDWTEVIEATALEEELTDSPSFLKLKECKRFCTCINAKHAKMKDGPLRAYYFKKIKKWIGPTLKKLAHEFDIKYDEEKAHDAMYDVHITKSCLLKMLDRGDVPFF